MKIKNQRLTELINNQIKEVKEENTLSFGDMRRILKYTNNSIFGKECSMWKGYITKSTSKNQMQYVSFFFRSKKRAIIRLLYQNYIGELHESSYLTHTCSNPSNCININHLKLKKQVVIYSKPKTFIISFD